MQEWKETISFRTFDFPPASDAVSIIVIAEVCAVLPTSGSSHFMSILSDALFDLRIVLFAAPEIMA
jgi:hypothetical protein